MKRKEKMEKSREVNEQIKYGLDSIDNERNVNIKLKDLMFIYKAIEEFRRFFHNKHHYPLYADIETYLGYKDFGAFSILDELYIKTLDTYIPDDIEKSLGDENDKLTHPSFPYYYNLKQKEKSKLSAAGNVEPVAYDMIKRMDYEVSKEGDLWKAEDYCSCFRASSPLELLGLISIYKSTGTNLDVEDNIIDEFIELDEK